MTTGDTPPVTRLRLLEELDRPGGESFFGIVEKEFGVAGKNRIADVYIYI